MASNNNSSGDNDNDIRGRRNSDMILAPNEYAFISDETKGEVNVFVGPNKTSLAGTDRCVSFDAKTKRFRATQTLDAGVQLFQTAPEGWYIVLKNPAVGDKHPTGSGKLTTPELNVGKKVNISGPASFPLWPGQMAKVVQGHSLKSNEYLLCRVYDEEAAAANINKAVVKKQDPIAALDTERLQELAGQKEALSKKDKNLSPAPSSAAFMTKADLSMGKLFVIKGTEVSFYIPPTGIEVVPEKVNGEERFVREAVTLERLEYCLLLDEDGNKRYVHGPVVVFPRPTEKFVEAPIKSNPDKAKAKKFRAQELTVNSGIHIRVIAAYDEDDGTHREAGEELFITGKEQTIYFPREEHAIIKYGDQDIHFGIAIPEGEARYVLNRETGVISVCKGPQIFLPDPRTQVIVQRALPLDLVRLMYPNNSEALEINAARLGIDDQDINAAAASYNRNGEDEAYAAVNAVATADSQRRVIIKAASKSLPGDSFDRKSKFTAPRALVLNTKYDGVVQTTLWTGYAMLLVKKNGERRVVQGPGTFMLEYDESPQVISLSTGKPKTTDNMYRTVFLLTLANKVSDVVEVETKDLVKVNVKVSYRVNFEGDPLKWFNVDNYVKFLTDNMRSRIRAAVKKLGIQEFYADNADIIRDVVLGKQTLSADNKTFVRTGTVFEENGMRVYDAEVLNVQMMNADVERLLVSSQRDAIQNALTLSSEQRKFEFVKETELLKRQVEETKAETQRQTMQINVETARLKSELDSIVIDSNAKAEMQRIAHELEAQKQRLAIADALTAHDNDVRERQIAIDKKIQALKVEMLKAEAQAVIDKATAISPDLIATLEQFGDKVMVEKLATAMAPMSLLGGDSAVDVVKKVLAGTKLADVLEAKKPTK